MLPFGIAERFIHFVGPSGLSEAEFREAAVELERKTTSELESILAQFFHLFQQVCVKLVSCDTVFVHFLLNPAKFFLERCSKRSKLRSSLLDQSRAMVCPTEAKALE